MIQQSKLTNVSLLSKFSSNSETSKADCKKAGLDQNPFEQGSYHGIFQGIG